MAETTIKAPEPVTIEAKLPARLVQEIESLIKGGWYPDFDSVVLEALRRFADTHREELIEAFAREDIEWGLRGSDDRANGGQ